MDTKAIRKQLNLTKYAFAKKLGVSWNTVHLWENYVWKPNKLNKERIKLLCK